MGHISYACPESSGSKGKGKKAVQVKKEPVSEVCIIESKAEDANYLSVPTMIIGTEIQNAPAKSLFDMGTAVNLILGMPFLAGEKVKIDQRLVR